MNKLRSLEEKGTELAIIDYMNRRENKTSFWLFLVYFGLVAIVLSGIEIFVFKNSHISDKNMLVKIMAVVGVIMLYSIMCLTTEKTLWKAIPPIKEALNKWVAENCAAGKVTKLRDYYINQLMDGKFASSKDARQHLEEMMGLELINTHDKEIVERFISEYEIAVNTRGVPKAIKRLITRPLTSKKLLSKYPLVDIVNALIKKA